MISIGKTTNTTVSSLVEGATYFFAVTAYYTSGEESDYSHEVAYIVPGILAIIRGSNSVEPIRIRFPVAPGHGYKLEASQDLKSWTTIWKTGAVSNSWIEFGDPGARKYQRRFYRLVLY
jgi:hypothetical protein